jgi:hypothetical protein
VQEADARSFQAKAHILLAFATPGPPNCPDRGQVFPESRGDSDVSGIACASIVGIYQGVYGNPAFPGIGKTLRRNRTGPKYMIVSASYKTDIPALYGQWFMNRLKTGFCRVTNPYNQKAFDVPLDRESVDGFVFWTRNIGPFLTSLTEIRRLGYPFYVQYTITGYPNAIDRSVPDADRMIRQFKQLNIDFGHKSTVWRYDPIAITSLTDRDFHLVNFRNIAQALRGSTNEVVVSFPTLYRKTRRNLDRAANEFDFQWRDIATQDKRSLISELADIAHACNMRLTVCSQNSALVEGVSPARCVDAGRLSQIAGQPIAAKEMGSRPGCLCHQSKDIGTYDTCPHGCVYCYAVDDREEAARRYQAHDPDGAFLFPPVQKKA